MQWVDDRQLCDEVLDALRAGPREFMHAAERWRADARIELFAVLVPLAFDVEPVIAEEAFHTVRFLAPLVPWHRWTTIDADLRWSLAILEGGRRFHSYLDLTPATLDDWNARRPGVAALALAHRDGFVRERALQLVARQREPWILALLLRRTADWADPVRRVASERVLERLDAGHAPLLLQWRPLVDYVPGGPRRWLAPMVERIDAFLAAPAQRSVLVAGATSNDRAVRRRALRLLGNALLEDVTLACAAVADADVVCRELAVQAVREAGTPDVARAVIARLRRSRSARMQAEAIDIAARKVPELLPDLVAAGLFHPNWVVRAQARFSGGETVRTRAPELARKALADADASKLVGALALLGETGSPDDAAILEQFLTNPRVPVRVEALHALAGLTRGRHPAIALAAISDPSTKVRRSAKRLKT